MIAGAATPLAKIKVADVSATIDLTESAILAIWRSFLLGVLPAGLEVVQGQDNRVPSPAGTDYAVYWPTFRKRLATNTVTASASVPAGLLDRNNFKQPFEIHIQTDLHGPSSSDNATMISTLARSEYATAFFSSASDAVQILYADDPKQMVFITGENQFEDRWVIEAVLQANPVTTTVQQFADVVTVGLIEVDTTYPPGA